MQFVWLYMHDSAASDDLKISMLSVAKMYQGDVEFVVVGDIPNWFTGTSVPVKRISYDSAIKITKTKTWHRYCDTMLKMLAWIDDARCENEFVWMMDDQAFLVPVSDNDLRVRRHHLDWKARGRSWDYLVAKTLERCANVTLSSGKVTDEPLVNYATHAPHLFGRDHMKYVYSVLNMPHELWLFDVAYDLLIREYPRTTVDFWFRMVRHKPVRRTYQKMDLGCVSVVNWNDMGRQHPDLVAIVREKLCVENPSSTRSPFALNTTISWP